VNPGFPFGPDGSEERIAKILNEANKAMASNSGKDMMPGTPPTSSAPLSFSSQVWQTVFFLFQLEIFFLRQNHFTPIIVSVNRIIFSAKKISLKTFFRFR
jgi:hypothetical protein